MRQTNNYNTNRMTTKHYYFAFYGGDILLERLHDGTYTIPCLEQPPTETGQDTDILDIAPTNGIGTKAYMMKNTPTANQCFELCGLRQSYYKLPHELYVKAGKCEELLYWNEHTKYCGKCGGKMELNTQISKKCTRCGYEAWPQLSTAIIVLVHKGDEVLLVHAKNFRGNFFGLVAGFVETGETLEEAVHREVIEETGLRIKDIRYFGSQPWPYPCGLMIGFNASYDGGTLKLQQSELSAGAWFSKDNLPEIPERLSIARKLIDAWLESTEAKH